MSSDGIRGIPVPAHRLYDETLKLAATLDNPAITPDELRVVVEKCSRLLQQIHSARTMDSRLSSLLWATSNLADRMLITEDSEWNTRAYGSAWQFWKYAREQLEQSREQEQQQIVASRELYARREAIRENYRRP